MAIHNLPQILQHIPSRRIQQNQGPGMGRMNNWAKRNRATLMDIAEVMTFRRALASSDAKAGGQPEGEAH